MKIYRKQIAALLMIAVIAYSGYGFACSASDVSKVKKKVADAAAILNSSAKINRQLYQSNLTTLEIRQKVAKGIHEANELLAIAVERAATLTPDDLPTGKTDIVKLLRQSVTVLQSLHIGNEKIDLTIQSAIAAINSAIVLTEAIRS